MTTRRTFTLEKVDDLDGLMTAEPAPSEPMVYEPDDFDGEFAQECGTFDGARTVTVTVTAGAWNEREDLQIEGFVHGVRRVEHLELPALAEREVTIRGELPFAFPPGVRVTMPHQPPGAGSFKIGLGDVLALDGTPLEDVRASDDGRVAVRYDADHDDQIEMLRGERLGMPVAAVRAEHTKVGVTVFFPLVVTLDERDRAARELIEREEHQDGR